MTIDARNGGEGVKITADYGRLDFGDRDIFNGNVEVLIEGKIAFRADQLELLNGKCIAIGNVVVTTPGLSGLRLTADHFMLEGDQIELTKNGHVSIERLSNISEGANNTNP